MPLINLERKWTLKCDDDEQKLDKNYKFQNNYFKFCFETKPSDEVMSNMCRPLEFYARLILEKTNHK